MDATRKAEHFSNAYAVKTEKTKKEDLFLKKQSEFIDNFVTPENLKFSEQCS